MHLERCLNFLFFCLVGLEHLELAGHLAHRGIDLQSAKFGAKGRDVVVVVGGVVVGGVVVHDLDADLALAVLVVAQEAPLLLRGRDPDVLLLVLLEPVVTSVLGVRRRDRMVRQADERLEKKVAKRQLVILVEVLGNLLEPELTADPLVAELAVAVHRLLLDDLREGHVERPRPPNAVDVDLASLVGMHEDAHPVPALLAVVAHPHAKLGQVVRIGARTGLALLALHRDLARGRAVGRRERGHLRDWRFFYSSFFKNSIF